MRKEFEKLPEIRKIMNENGIYFMNHSGWYEARDFKDFEYEQYINGAWYAWQAKAQAVPEWLRKSQEKVKVYELHVKTLKQIHENEFNEKSESSYILGNLDGFFECLESDLGEIK